MLQYSPLITCLIKAFLLLLDCWEWFVGTTRPHFYRISANAMLISFMHCDIQSKCDYVEYPFTVCALHHTGKNFRSHIQRFLQWMALYFYPMVLEAENDGQKLVVRYFIVKFCRQYMWDLLSLIIIAVFKLLHCIFAGCCRFYIFFCILSFKDFPLILLLRVLQKKYRFAFWSNLTGLNHVRLTFHSV